MQYSKLTDQRLFSATLKSLLLISAVFAVKLTAQDIPWPTEGWAVSTPAEQGLKGSLLDDLNNDIIDGKYGYVDRMVVVRHGKLVVNERYKNDYREISKGHTGALGCGVDMCPEGEEIDEYNYYHPAKHPYYEGRDVHSLQSVTKSVASVLIGIAIRRGKIESTRVPFLSFFEDYDLSRIEERLESATLEDLLTMRTGIEWHEHDRPLNDTNTTLQLEKSQDWIQFTLDQPTDANPGEKWVYNSGGSHLMSGIIKKATGMYVDEFADRYLFGPLGIREYYWKKTPKGYPDTEGGLYLEALDLAKIGYLFLQDGVWDGKRILPDGWVRASTTDHVEGSAAGGRGYGYQWWRVDRGDTAVWAGLGFGGQYLLVIPEYDLIGVINSWNIFGGRRPSLQRASLDAMLNSVDG